MTSLSIITINYNNRDGLRKTYNSLIGQEQSFEWVVIDGASDDGSADVINEAARYFNPTSFVWVSEPDQGLYDAMNKGIGIARNDFCIFMNSGDWFADGAVESILSAINSDRRLKFLFGDYYRVHDSSSSYIPSRDPSRIKNGMFTSHQAMVYSLVEIKKRNIFFNISYKYSSDYDFTARFLNDISRSECLCIRRPLCFFDMSGVSNRKRVAALAEDAIIRKEVFGLGRITIVGIYLLNYLHHYLKVLAPRLINSLRKYL